MNATLQKSLEKIEREGIHLEFDKILDFAWNSWKKVTLPAIAGMLLLTLIFGGITVLLIPFLFGMSFSDLIELAQNNSAYMSEVSNSFDFKLKSILLTVIFVFVGAPINVGFLRMAHNYAEGQEVKVSNIFYYYKQPYFIKLVISALVVGVLTSLFSLGLSQVNAVVGGIGNVIVNVLSLFFVFAAPLIAFGDAGIVEAYKISFNVVSRKFWLIIGLFIIGFLFQIVGLMACCIGILFTMSFIYTLQYGMYRAIFIQEGVEDFNEGLTESEIVE